MSVSAIYSTINFTIALHTISNFELWKKKNMELSMIMVDLYFFIGPISRDLTCKYCG